MPPWLATLIKADGSTMKAKTEAGLESLRLADLVPHPDQVKYFGPYGENERAALQSNIEANGLRVPIEVLPPRNRAGLPALTIISGHTRCEILIGLDHVVSDVRVRHDLAKATRSEVDVEFIADNFARRQLDPLDRARVALRLFELERDKRGRKTVDHPPVEGELRDRIGLILGVSGRNLARYLLILKTPTEVQRAFQEKKLKLVEAAKIGALPKKTQLQFAARLRDGEDARAVFTGIFPPRDGKHMNAADALASFVRSLGKAHADLADRVDVVHPNLVLRAEVELRRGRKLIRTLLKKLEPDSE